MDNKKTARDNRRYKYGSLSIVFTVVFIALIIVLNLVFSSLSISGYLTVDLTEEDFTSIGEESLRLLRDLGEDLDITIYFMAARDAFDSDAYNHNGVNLYALVRDTAENYAREFTGGEGKGKVQVVYKELNTDPAFEEKILEEAATQLTRASVIVQGKYHYRVLGLQAFFEVTENNEYYSYNGEYRLTTAMLQSSISEPQLVSFTVGHGEQISASLLQLYVGAGFSADTVNLSESDIDPRTTIIVCSDPQTDFSYAEIDKLNKYMNTYKSFTVMVDSATPTLPNLQSFLNDGWGINYHPQYRVSDDVHSLDGDRYNINAKYPQVASDSTSSMASYQIFKTVADMGGIITTSLPQCVELSVRPGITQDNFTIENVLTSYETASSATASGEQGTSGEMPIALLSTRSAYGENNVRRFAYVMLIGSTEFASDSNLAASQRGNRRIALAAARVFGSQLLAPDIDSKPFGSTALDIETGTANTLTWLICTIVPGIVLILGIVMFFRRRHL